MTRRSLLLFVLLIGCTSYKGPAVDELLPKNQETWLAGQVADPATSGLSHLVVYGDSLSDMGALHKNTWGFLLPEEIFYKGRFSNGPVWVEYVQNALRWTVDNYAVGGAETHSSKFPDRLVIPSLSEQIEKSGSRLEELNPEKTLIAIWIGPNNYLRNGTEYQNAKGELKSDLLTAGVERNVSEIREAIETIRKLGFRHLAVGTMPELGGLNRNPKGGIFASDATLYRATKLHNEALLTMITDLKAKAPDLQLVTYNAFAINQATIDDPKSFGFVRLDAPCFVGSLGGEFYGPGAFCKDPMGYKFWEYIHPNTKMQCYYASQFLGDLAKADLIGGYDKEKTTKRCLAIESKTK